MARQRPKDHYDALGVPRNADLETIRKAYRRRAKECHPDAGAGADPAAFLAAQTAYEALKDPERRRAYDLELRRRETGRTASAADSRGNRSRRSTDPFTAPFGTDTGRRQSSDRGSAAGPGGNGRREGAAPGGMEDLFGEEDELFARVLRELFGGGAAPGGGSAGRGGFGGFGDMYSDPDEAAPFSSPGTRHRHMRDAEPFSVVVHLSPDETYTGGTISVDLGAGRSILAEVPPGVRHGDVVRSEFVDRDGPRELKLHIRVG